MGYDSLCFFVDHWLYETTLGNHRSNLVKQHHLSVTFLRGLRERWQQSRSGYSLSWSWSSPLCSVRTKSQLVPIASSCRSEVASLLGPNYTSAWPEDLRLFDSLYSVPTSTLRSFLVLKFTEQNQRSRMNSYTWGGRKKLGKFLPPCTKFSSELPGSQSRLESLGKHKSSQKQVWGWSVFSCMKILLALKTQFPIYPEAKFDGHTRTCPGFLVLCSQR